MEECKEGTIADAVVRVLKQTGQPMMVAAITEAIVEQGLYLLNSK